MKIIQYSRVVGVGALLLAVASLAALGWMAYDLSVKRVALSEYRNERDAIATRDTYAASLQALARDTVVEREELRAFVTGRDTVEMIELLRSAGSAASLVVRVESVDSGSAAAVVGASDTVLVTLRTGGTFRQVFHFLSLLNTLPAIASLEQVRIERVGDSETEQWALYVQVRSVVQSS